MKRRTFLFFSLLLLNLGCGGEAGDLLDLADGVERAEIDQSKLGTNAFFAEPEFGTVPEQFTEVRDTLGLRYVRALFAWTNSVQPTPSAIPDLAFYDEIASRIPEGVDVLVVLTGLPTWMQNSDNWIEGDPRRTFVDRWVIPIAERYSLNERIIGWQIWNEPNMTVNPENSTLDIATDGGKYVEMLSRAYIRIKAISPEKLVLNAATTAINQNFPESLNYNRQMRDAGAVAVTDRWAIHYYGEQYENIVRPDGIKDFFRSISKAIWVTESGKRGFDKQLAYGERTWPYLIDNLDDVERIYQYRFVENALASDTWGMRNTSATPLSDLYVYLRDN